MPVRHPAPSPPTVAGRRPAHGRRAGVALAVVAAVALAGAAPAAQAEPLVGTFKIQKGTYAKRHGKVRVTGSYFRMIYPNGTAKKGPWFKNNDSRAKDGTYTLFRPGIDGGLRTGEYQEFPTPAFDSRGFALGNRIVRPLPFAGIDFSLATAAKDYQSGGPAGLPAVNRKGRRLSGDLRAFTAAWNGIYFNQGTPKANGTRPGKTGRLRGTYDRRTRRYTLEWTSQIVGGPFNDFTGHWFLAGTFVPRP